MTTLTINKLNRSLNRAGFDRVDDTTNVSLSNLDMDGIQFFVLDRRTKNLVLADKSVATIAVHKFRDGCYDQYCACCDGNQSWDALDVYLIKN